MKFRHWALCLLLLLLPHLAWGQEQATLTIAGDVASRTVLSLDDLRKISPRPVEGIVTVTMEVGNTHLRSRVTQRAVDQLDLRPGQQVYALVKAVSLDRQRVGCT